MPPDERAAEEQPPAGHDQPEVASTPEAAVAPEGPGVEIEQGASATIAALTAVPVSERWDTTGQTLITTTEARLRNILHEQGGALSARRELVGPFTLVVTIITTLAVGVKSHVLSAALLIALGLSLFWLASAIRTAWRYRMRGGVDSIVESLKPKP